MNESKTNGSPDTAALLAPFKSAIQVGVVVRDIEQTMKQLTAVFGIGPFRVIECPPKGREDRQFLDGQPAHFRTRQAFADLGNIELELIQTLEGRTTWSDFLAEHGPGIHHIRFNVPDHAALTTYLRGKGIGVTQEGAGIRDGTYWVNYDTEKLLGFVIEIMQPAPGSDGRTPGVTRTSAQPSGGHQ
ncbi:MAG: VOC family protein [Candidatus Omnitrophica bacterium]|nr:VOC family protein [Candidatus Omnitrophota bacterium]